MWYNRGCVLMCDPSRIQVVSKNNVMECTPQIPSPGLIFDEAELRGFLLLKSK